MENNFQVLPASLVTSFGVPYDYGSIMHYSAYAFSSNGQRTIQPRVSKLSIYFGINLSVLRQDLWFFIKTIRITRTQNNEIRQVVRHQPVSAKARVRSLVSLSGVYGGCVAVGQICLSTSIICWQCQSTNVPQSFTYLSPKPNNLRKWHHHQMTHSNKTD